MIMIIRNNILQSISKVQGVYPKSITLKDSVYSIPTEVKTSSFLNGTLFLIDYRVEIAFPENFPKELPKVFVPKGELNKNFGHINGDDSLCLGTDVDLRIRMSDGEPIEMFLKILKDYLTEYQYWREYHKYAIKPRSHGNHGVIETYQEMMHVKDVKIIHNLLSVIPVKNLDRNKLCPCKSGLKMKNCHYHVLAMLSENKSIVRQAKKDVDIFNEYY